MHTSGVNSKLIHVLIIIAAIMGIAFLLIVSNYFYQKTKYVGDAETDTFSVTGFGKITAVPDIALIGAGFEVTKKTVAEAQKENTEKMNEFYKDLKTLGISEKDIRTSQYSINPRYEYPPERKPELVGYTITHAFEIKIRDLEKISKAISLFGEHGLNQVGGLTFTIDDPDKLKQQAMEKAIENAKEKAARIAGASGIKLGPIVSFSENTQLPPPHPIMPMMERAEKDMAIDLPPIQSGSQDVESTVTVSYEIVK